MALNLRTGSAALLSIAIGGIAGRLIDVPFGLPQEAMTFLYQALPGVFEALASNHYAELVLVTLLYRLPSVLALGLLIGLILNRVQYPRLLVYCLFAWPAYDLLTRLLFISFLQRGEETMGGPALAAPFFRERLGLEMTIYCVEYLLLLVVIFATNAAVVRAKRLSRAA